MNINLRSKSRSSTFKPKSSPARIRDYVRPINSATSVCGISSYRAKSALHRGKEHRRADHRHIMQSSVGHPELECHSTTALLGIASPLAREKRTTTSSRLLDKARLLQLSSRPYLARAVSQRTSCPRVDIYTTLSPAADLYSLSLTNSPCWQPNCLFSCVA